MHPVNWRDPNFAAPPPEYVAPFYSREAELHHSINSIGEVQNPGNSSWVEIADLIKEVILIVFALPIGIIYIIFLGLSVLFEFIYNTLSEPLGSLWDWLFVDEIPESFHNDPTLSQHVCPITLNPIRYPVRDRNHPEHVYEKRAILQWLENNRRSPLTREPMTPNDLVPHVELQNQIEARLAVLRRNNPPASQAQQPIPRE